MSGPPPPPPPPMLPLKPAGKSHEEVMAQRAAEGQSYCIKVSVEHARASCDLPTLLRVLTHSPAKNATSHTTHANCGSVERDQRNSSSSTAKPAATHSQTPQRPSVPTRTLRMARREDVPDIYWMSFHNITATNRQLVHHEAKVIFLPNRDDEANEDAKASFGYVDAWNGRRLCFPKKTRHVASETQPLLREAKLIHELRRSQCVNYFVGMANACNKANLAAFINAYQRAHPQLKVFAPPSWTLPLQSAEFKQLLTAQPALADQVFIAKPEVGSKAHGITFYRGGDVLDAFESGELSTGDKKGRNRMVIQHYVNNPLLIRKKKWDLRVYVLLTSLHPLRAYLYHDGLARFCANEYVPLQSVQTNDTANGPCGAPQNAGEVDQDERAGSAAPVGYFAAKRAKARKLDPSYYFTHITNYAVNKRSENFKIDECKRTANEAFIEYFRAADAGPIDEGTPGVPVGLSDKERLDNIWASVGKLCAHTIRAMEPYLRLQYTTCFEPSDDPTDYTKCFQILGFDVMFDEHLQPWLLEVNSAPSLVLSRDSLSDRALKLPLVEAAMRIGYAQTCHRDPTPEERGEFCALPFDVREIA